MKATILIFSLWMAKAQAACPTSCNCTETSVSCVNQSLEAVPNLNILEFSPIILDFSGNKLLFVDEEDFTFPKNDEVREIYLNNSGVADIGEGTFDGLENLQELYLSQNMLSSDSVTYDIIAGLDNMVLLDMSYNYFNGDMPIIKSDSLKVFGLINSKISAIPKNALEALPNLKVLMLQQNSIKTIWFETFENYPANSIFLKLSFNSWTCDCDNLKTFDLLASKRLLETTESYQCYADDDKVMNIFSTDGAIEKFREECDNSDEEDEKTDYDINNMVDKRSRKVIKNMLTEKNDFYSQFYNDDDREELDISQMNDEQLDAILPDNCWQRFPFDYINNGVLLVAFISITTSFFLGFLAGAIFCKIMYNFRYKKLDQSSDSQVTLLRA
ncbi:slit homolog 3 protein-like [Anthonomus grandis grandis]|uniref:slit homolog 3 protein-like n=1 Tax=Anthonomus grandis grandis TaxID=2921223 RepID=UPI00216697B9|nr:slit homolog 3 protein-like [Anthonomus grandis grandis]XP_050297609.1 slit homolog 3 protein-like [Anthonomus grandis grandis]